MGRSKAPGITPTRVAVALGRWLVARPAWGIFLLCILLHANSIFNGVAWDDRAAVTYNRDIADGPDYWNHDYWGQPMTAPDSHKSWRPLATLSFRLNYLAHGYAPAGYHLANVLIHACACVFVLVLARQCYPGDEAAAGVAAVAFAIHPVRDAERTFRGDGSRRHRGVRRGHAVETGRSDVSVGRPSREDDADAAKSVESGLPRRSTASPSRPSSGARTSWAARSASPPSRCTFAGWIFL